MRTYDSEMLATRVTIPENEEERCYDCGQPASHACRACGEPQCADCFVERRRCFACAAQLDEEY